MKRTVFIDLDGTLFNPQGSVPPTAQKAIQLAQQKGHSIFLATGRSIGEIPEEVQAMGLDGIIGAGGAYIQLGQEVLQNKTIAEEDIAAAVEFLELQKAGYYLETDQGIVVSENCLEVIHQVVGEGQTGPEKKELLEQLKSFFELLEQRKAPRKYSRVNKINFINQLIPFEVFENELSHRFTLHRATIAQLGQNSGELSVKNCSKGNAIQHLASHMGFPLETTLGYGDSYNDVEMFKAVAHAVAMENAPKEVKAHADEITQTPEQNGIYNSFQRNGLL